MSLYRESCLLRFPKMVSIWTTSYDQSNQSLQLTAGQNDDQLYFYETRVES